jgi:hypothetical protein
MRAAAHRAMKIAARQHEHGGPCLARCRTLGALNHDVNSSFTRGKKTGKTGQKHSDLGEIKPLKSDI